MSAHVLLNLLNELRKRDKMRGVPSIISLFRDEFNKFNKTGARIYHMTLKLLKNAFCPTKRQDFATLTRRSIWRLLFNNTLCPPQHKSIIVYYYIIYL